MARVRHRIEFEARVRSAISGSRLDLEVGWGRKKKGEVDQAQPLAVAVAGVSEAEGEA